MDQGGTGPPDPDLVGGPTHAGTPHLIIYDELIDRIGPETPRSGPVRSHVAGVGQLARCRLRMLHQPSTEVAPRRVFISRKGEIHGAKRRLYG
jgi:hypothetical protein